MTELHNIIKPDPDVVITELEDSEAVLLHLGTKMYFTLNETGLRVWQLMSSGLTPGEIITKLTDEFNVTQEKARECVQNLIDELINEKLVRVVDE